MIYEAASLRRVTTLNTYGVDICYPGNIPGMTQKEAQDAIRLAEEVREAIIVISEPTFNSGTS